MVVNNRV